MKHLRYILLVMILPLMAAMALPCVAADATAGAILTALHKKMTAAEAIDAAFTINAGGGASQGSVQLAGAKFTLVTPQIKVWYDGKTQWTLLTASQEVSITEPTADEVLVTNPFAILADKQEHYSARRLSDVQGMQRVELTPRRKGTGITSFTLYINPSTSWPKAIAIVMDDGQRVDVAIDNISPAKAKPAAVFKYDAKKYPAAEIVDLR